MLFARVLGVALLSLVTSTAATSSNDTGHDFFVASDNSLALTLNVANETDDIYFSFTGPDASSWISFGLGSDRMESAIMFMVYASSSGTNITLSSRLPSNHIEPSYSAAIQVEVLEGSRISNGTITANFKCSNCRGSNAAKISSSYSLDSTSTSQKMCYASGPSGSLKSDDLNVATKRHSTYGAFTMDMVRATGPGGVTPASLHATLDIGSAETSHKKDINPTPIHAAVMIFAFLILMPFGVITLRVFGSVRWHGINQGVSAGLAVVGSFLGIYIAMMYNRSKSFNSAHQILGIVIFLALIAQFVLGYLHHRIYKKTKATTKMAPVHVWMGRGMLPAAIIDALLGFPLAQSPTDDYWFVGIAVAVCLALTLILVWNSRRKAKKAKETTFAQPAEGDEEEQRIEHSSVELQRMQQHPPAYSGN